MKLDKSQTGFSHIALLLFMVVFAGVGFAGWKVYDANKSIKATSSSSTSTSATATSTEKSRTSNSITPDGYIEYKNEELGFKFVYPKEWGEVTLQKDAGGEKGHRYRLRFSKLDHTLAGLLSADFENHKDFDCKNDIGVFPGSTIASLSDYMKNGDEEFGNAKTSTRVLKKTEDTVIYEKYESGDPPMPDCIGLTITAYKLFSNNVKFRGIEFFWATEEIDMTTIPIGSVDLYKKDPSKYISDRDRQNFIKTVESAQSL